MAHLGVGVDRHDDLPLVLDEFFHAHLHLLERGLVRKEWEGGEVDQAVVDAVVALVADPDGKHHRERDRQDEVGLGRHL